MKDGPFESCTTLSVDKSIIKERGSPITCREWGWYPGAFLLSNDPEYWNGKTILDVGSGIKWTDPSKIFPGAKVCAIDPEFGKGGRIQWNTADEIRLGIAQEIPYGSNSFDHVFSSHAVPQHVYPIDMPIAVLEMLRVAKPSGDVRLTPCVQIDIIGISELLERAGFKIDLSQKGSGGPIAIIRAESDIQNPEKKDEALNRVRLLMGLTSK